MEVPNDGFSNEKDSRQLLAVLLGYAERAFFRPREDLRQELLPAHVAQGLRLVSMRVSSEDCHSIVLLIDSTFSSGETQIFVYLLLRGCDHAKL